MKCSKCGFDNQGESKRFCGQCGLPLATARGKAVGPLEKMLCDGCMGAFPPEQLAPVDEQNLCNLCQHRHNRDTARSAGDYYEAPGQGSPIPPAPSIQSFDSPLHTSGWAVASLVLAIVFFPLGFLAIIAGVLGIRQINRRPEELEGKGLAIAGIVLGSLTTLGTVCLAMTIIPSIIYTVDITKRTFQDIKTVQVLKAIEAAEEAHFQEYGRYGDLEELFVAECLSRSALSAHKEYLFEAMASDDGTDFACTATPLKFRNGNYFFLDKSGTLRQEKDRTATSQSPVYRGPNQRFRKPPPRVLNSSSG
jgi:hypothetical protein